MSENIVVWDEATRGRVAEILRDVALGGHECGDAVPGCTCDGCEFQVDEHACGREDEYVERIRLAVGGRKVLATGVMRTAPCGEGDRVEVRVTEYPEMWPAYKQRVLIVEREAQP